MDATNVTTHLSLNARGTPTAVFQLQYAAAKANASNAKLHRIAIVANNASHNPVSPLGPQRPHWEQMPTAIGQAHLASPATNFIHFANRIPTAP